MRSYDLIVIGAGSGLDVAVEAAKRGLRTAIIEKGPLGGTCLNRGCIPSKMIIHSADLMEGIKKSAVFGFSTSITSVNFKKVTDRANTMVDSDARTIEQSLRSGDNPKLYKAAAEFTAPSTLRVGAELLKGKKIVIAAGARPFVPPIKGLEGVPFMTSTEALRQTQLPRSMIIIGGGYVGVELGHFYAAFGCKVTILQRGKLLIPREDRDIAGTFTAIWQKKVGVVCDCPAERVEQQGKQIVVYSGSRRFAAEKLLIATGIKPNTDLLKVEKAGIKTDIRGFIKVNKYMETSWKNVWALGDIAGVYLFKHSANLEAEYVLNNILGKKKAVDYYPMPHAIFSSPQVAGVGLTEQECIEKKKQYVVGRYDYKNTGMGAALAEEDGFVKLIVDEKSREILGCHILGPDASTLLHETVVAMKANRRKALDILRSAVHVHPALSEVVQRAALSVKV